jgi:hypothetical protein
MTTDELPSVKLPRLYANFDHLAGDSNTLDLLCCGSIQDIQKLFPILRQGMAVTFYTGATDKNGKYDPHLVDGTLRLTKQGWQGKVKWSTLRRQSEEPK